MDAVIVHTRHGAELLGGGARVHVIPHGAFEHLTRQPDERPLPAELAAVEGPVVLCFGVVRPYKGVDVLRRGVPRRSRAPSCGWSAGRSGCRWSACAGSRRRASVRFVPRYVSDPELPAFFRRADLLVLPHRSVDVSGVLFAGLAFGKPMVLSDVGRLPRGRRGPRRGPARAARRPGRAGATRSRELLADPAERERLAERARGRGRRAVLVGPDRRADAGGLRGGAGA